MRSVVCSFRLSRFLFCLLRSNIERLAMSDRTYGPCACGDRCGLSNRVPADSQHKCPWCEGFMHGICGEASAQYGPHADGEKDLTGLVWGRVCFNCAEKRTAELAASGTACVTDWTCLYRRSHLCYRSYRISPAYSCRRSNRSCRRTTT